MAVLQFMITDLANLQAEEESKVAAAAQTIAENIKETMTRMNKAAMSTIQTDPETTEIIIAMAAEEMASGQFACDAAKKSNTSSSCIQK